MRLASLSIALAVIGLAGNASAAEINTGKELVDSCAAYIAKGEDTIRDPDPCKRFLIGFFTAYKASEDARRQAIINGLPATTSTSCVYLPAKTSWREMAQRVVNYGSAHQNELAGPATALVQHTIERDVPCPPPR